MKNHGGGWNKGAAVGPRTAFAKQELREIGRHLARHGVIHDLCLLALGLDTMLRSSDLLSLTVADVIHPDGAIRRQLRRKQQKTKHNVYPALTSETRQYVRRWIEVSGKRHGHFLFTGTKPIDAPAIGRGQYARKVKQWAQLVGKPSGDYSTHSIRRSKPRHMYQQGEDIALISRLLGHKSPAVTLDYLGIEQDQADAATLRHVMLGKVW
jgi:integrase